MEINPRHPLIKELLRRVQDDPSDPAAKDIAVMMFRTATLRSGFMLKDTADFAESVELMMKKTLGIPLEDQAEEEEEIEEEETKSEDNEVDAEKDDDEDDDSAAHEEL